MSTLGAWWWRLGGLFDKDRKDRELADELESHVQMQTDENLRAGMNAQQARRQALIALGGLDQTKERYRQRRGIPFIESLLQDTRFGLRMLRKSPGFTAVAVLTLALGIGANTAVFTVVNAVLLAPLPYPESDRIVEVMRTSPFGNQWSMSIPKFMVYRRQSHVFQSFAAYDFMGPGINLTDGDRPEQVKGIHASAGYFDVFKSPVAQGRVFTAEEDHPGGPRVAVISNALWRTRFAGDSQIVGKTLDLSGDPYQIVGVLSPEFKSNPEAEVWLPLQADPNNSSQGQYLMLAARLAPNITLKQAQAAMKLAAEEFRREYPTGMDPNESATAVPLRDSLVVHARPALLILSGAVGFVLLIACANIASLLLARATLRKHEIAIRVALGAGRRRILRQMLTESMLLSLAGGVLGLGIGFVGVRALLAAHPVDMPQIVLPQRAGVAVALDVRVLVVTLLASLLTGIVFGLAPALSASRAALGAVLREGSSRLRSGFRQNRGRSVLVVSEISLALVLLAGAALLLKTFATLRSVRPGFDAQNVLTMEMSLSGSRFQKTGGVAQALRGVEERVGALPGVENIGSTCCLPLLGGPDLPFSIEGHAPANGSVEGDVQWRNVSSQYFQALRIPLLRGRVFTARDNAEATPVVVISEAMARRYWPRGDELGARITIGHGIGREFEDMPREVIGVVGSVRDESLGSVPAPMMYVPQSQVPDGVTALVNRILPLIWVVRTKSSPFALVTNIRRELSIATGGLPVAHVRSMEQVIGESTSQGDFNTVLLSIFAGVALLLAAIGIYGLMAYSVQQRTQEIGIRVALGANPECVRAMILRDGIWLAGAGVLLGVVAGLGLTRFMSSLIYGVKPRDPETFVFVALLLVAVSLLACWIPARRATKIDPMVALRYE